MIAAILSTTWWIKLNRCYQGQKNKNMEGRNQQASSPSGLYRPAEAIVVAGGEDALSGTERCQYGNTQSGGSQTKPGVQRKHRPKCKFYVSSSCKFGSQCKFYHPRPRCSPVLVIKECDGQEKPEPKGNANSERAPTDLSLGMFMGAVKLRPPVARPERVKCKTPTDLLQASVPLLHS